MSDSEPPRLHFDLGRRLTIFLIANAIPCMIVIWLVMGLNDGSLKLRDDISSAQLLATGLLTVVALGVYIGGAWFVLPVARWLRANPTWHFHNRSRAVWLLPMLCGQLLWAVFGVAAVIAMLYALYMLGSVAWAFWEII